MIPRLVFENEHLDFQRNVPKYDPALGDWVPIDLIPTYSSFGTKGVAVSICLGYRQNIIRSRSVPTQSLVTAQITLSH